MRSADTTLLSNLNGNLKNEKKNIYVYDESVFCGNGVGLVFYSIKNEIKVECLNRRTKVTWRLAGLPLKCGPFLHF